MSVVHERHWRALVGAARREGGGGGGRPSRTSMSCRPRVWAGLMALFLGWWCWLVLQRWLARVRRDERLATGPSHPLDHFERRDAPVHVQGAWTAQQSPDALVAVTARAHRDALLVTAAATASGPDEPSPAVVPPSHIPSPVVAAPASPFIADTAILWPNGGCRASTLPRAPSYDATSEVVAVTNLHCGMQSASTR